mmetsp:Transcript_40391/g.129638  ORF Transcript_40391/g.129638 Transcript_40391/m.129638 type:complete len:241 (+) Transcript_40391:1268-1990(+)
MVRPRARTPRRAGPRSPCASSWPAPREPRPAPKVPGSSAPGTRHGPLPPPQARPGAHSSWCRAIAAATVGCDCGSFGSAATAAETRGPPASTWVSSSGSPTAEQSASRVPGCKTAVSGGRAPGPSCGSGGRHAGQAAGRQSRPGGAIAWPCRSYLPCCSERRSRRRPLRKVAAHGCCVARSPRALRTWLRVLQCLSSFGSTGSCLREAAAPHPIPGSRRSVEVAMFVLCTVPCSATGQVA